MAQGVNKYKGQPLKVKGLVTIGRVKICQSCKTIKRTCFYCSTYAFWVKLCRRVMREDHCHFTTALSIFMLTPSWVLWENQDHSNASATHRLWNVRSPQHIKYNALFHSVSPHIPLFSPRYSSIAARRLAAIKATIYVASLYVFLMCVKVAAAEVVAETYGRPNLTQKWS